MESNEVVNTKINPILIVVGIILIVVSALIGWYIGGNKANRPLEKEENKTEEKAQAKSTFEVELFDESNENYVEISLKDDESIKSFIKSTDSLANFSFRKAFLEGETNLIDEFKRAYILSFYTEHSENGLYFKTEFLNNEINKVFSGSEKLFNNISSYSGYGSAESYYLCDNSLCMVHVILGGGISRSGFETSIVSSRVEGDNVVYTLKDYYYDYIEDNKYVYVSMDRELLCSSDACPEDIVATYSDMLNTYEMTFDKDNRYVSSRKIN